MPAIYLRPSDDLQKKLSEARADAIARSIELLGALRPAFLIACETVPGMRATVVDLPEVAEIAGEFVAEAGLSERVSVHPANLTVDKMTGEFDVVVLRYLLQVPSSQDAASLLKNLYDAVARGGNVHILGWVLADDLQSPPAAVNFYLVFVNLYDDGAAYTQAEHRAWLEADGFIDVRFGPAPSGGMPPGTTLVSATKP